VSTNIQKTRVLFIGGEGRSGSTVLERLLAVHPRTAAVGEAKYLFDRGVGQRELCGCGQPVPECPLWSEVGKQLVGGWESRKGRELVRFFAKVNKPSRLPVTVMGRGAMVRRARDVLADLYPLIAELTGSSVIIDSSKHPSWAHLLTGTETVDLRVVHLVRHPSGVVQSWSRPLERPQAASGTGEQMMPAHSSVEVVIRWNTFNRLFERLARRSVPTILVRYEDYVEALEDTVRACLGLVGLAYDSMPLAMTSGHGIAGNPSRFARDDTQISVDDRWVTELGGAKHALVSAATRRRRRTYGYRFNRSLPTRPILRHAAGQLVVAEKRDPANESARLEPSKNRDAGDDADERAEGTEDGRGTVVGQVAREQDEPLDGR